jgi:hypothetical protein
MIWIFKKDRRKTKKIQRKIKRNRSMKIIPEFLSNLDFLEIASILHEEVILVILRGNFNTEKRKNDYKQPNMRSIRPDSGNFPSGEDYIVRFVCLWHCETVFGCGFACDIAFQRKEFQEVSGNHEQSKT